MFKTPDQNGKKNKKVIIAVTAVIVAVLASVAVIKGISSKKEANEPVTEQTTKTEETTLGEIVIEEDKTKKEEKTTSSEDEVLILEPQEPKTTTKKTTQQNSTKQKSQVQPAESVTKGNTIGISQGTNKEVIVNGNDSVYEYSCGVKGHHCDSKETHDFIVSLEKKGCPYCGSHSCKSFYTYDEWGNACYDPTKCESYSTQNDPCYTCQECGKTVGDGSNSTCVRFNVDTKCPVCGKTVKAKTCHSH